MRGQILCGSVFIIVINAEVIMHVDSVRESTIDKHYKQNLIKRQKTTYMIRGHRRKYKKVVNSSYVWAQSPLLPCVSYLQFLNTEHVYYIIGLLSFM